MRRHVVILGAVLLTVLSIGYAQAPVPFINLPLVPDAVAPGSGDFTLTVNGTGFLSNSVINWNGTALATQFVNGSRLTATVSAEHLATASTAWVTVVTPAPGGGTSNTSFFTVTPNVGDSLGFTLASSVVLGEGPNSVAVGDFNGDSKPDLATANQTTVSILLGDGAGDFALVSSPTVGEYPRSLAIGDFNGDDKADLADVNAINGTVSILLGDGTGNFTLASSPATGAWPVFVAAGDFNRDGKLDLATANWNRDTVSILLGDGTGNFALASSPAVGRYPGSIAVGDFNEDGKLDLAVTSEATDTVSILLGDGTGNFTLTSSPSTGECPDSVAMGDFNADGTLDLAVGAVCSGSANAPISVLLGDGTGNFAPASSSAAGSMPFLGPLGDLNGDSTLDLVTANQGDKTGSILLGDGTGSFTLTSSPIVGADPMSVAVGDFNGDGKLDLATINYGSDTVSILLQGPAPPAVTLFPASLTFGTQLIGTASASQGVTLSNSSNATLGITNIAGSANFTQTNNCGSSVAAGASCTISVTFRPRGTGTLTGSITISDNAVNSPQRVSLTGIGTAVTLLPSSLNFGGQTVRTTSQPQTATLTNYGKKALKISGIHISGTNPAAFVQTNTCGTNVTSGGSCNISVTFTPKGEGFKSATLNVRDDGGASPQTVALTGTGK